MRAAMRGLVASIVLAGMTPASRAVDVEPVVDPLDRPAQRSARVPRVFLDAVTRAGPRLVAVGERGIVLWSDDAGAEWHQAAVPVSVTLTAVQFVSPSTGWAIGHGGVVLRSTDGGVSWTRRADGRSLARRALDDATAKAAGADAEPSAQTHLRVARQLVDDGPDKPLLALSFRDADHGVVAGAYGLVFATDDGGLTWTSWMDRVRNPKGLHVYAIARDGGSIYLAGEQGLLLASSDDGRTFRTVDTPYRGSYFAVAISRSGAVVVAGLRGTVQRSDDRGATWHQVGERGGGVAPVSITSIATQTDGGLLFANQAGRLTRSGDEARSFEPVATPPGSFTTAIAEAADGTLVGVGPRGAMRIGPPAVPGSAR